MSVIHPPLDLNPQVKLTGKINTAFTTLGELGLKKCQIIDAKYKLGLISNVIGWKDLFRVFGV